jgi:tRNA pseudouridine38-40 synthase
MSLFRITVAYDGTDFAGWQSQGGAATAARTVQAVLENALQKLGGGTRVAVVGAGRTDAGVHALGQVASFELPSPLQPEDLQRALNALLPRDVRVMTAAFAPPGFHARRSAVSKLYRYELDTGRLQWPTRRRLAGHVAWTLDAAVVREAAALFVGRRDFASLASSGGSTRTTVRTVTRSEAVFVDPRPWGRAADGECTLVYEIEADGFLRKMVRSLVGGLIAVGRGVASVEDLRRALEARDRGAWPAPAPACGLALVRVDYAAMLE